HRSDADGAGAGAEPARHDRLPEEPGRPRPDERRPLTGRAGAARRAWNSGGCRGGPELLTPEPPKGTCLARRCSGHTCTQVEPSGHAVRMDALHLIRAAAEMADTVERDAQTASASQLRRTEEEVTRRQRELQEREAQVESYRGESERQRAEMINAAKAEARQT